VIGAEDGVVRVVGRAKRVGGIKAGHDVGRSQKKVIARQIVCREEAVKLDLKLRIGQTGNTAAYCRAAARRQRVGVGKAAAIVELYAATWPAESLYCVETEPRFVCRPPSCATSVKDWFTPAT
jgi:hypothetical protein